MDFVQKGKGLVWTEAFMCSSGLIGREECTGNVGCGACVGVLQAPCVGVVRRMYGTTGAWESVGCSWARVGARV